ncbi:MAG TPA: phosphoribosylformylglycinamidine synthase subunit PurQ [Nitrospinota bacterium]|jgi:phosphoribosylformylglycinamidine synthase|nr:phosphoribosylformylglycinamidine synthase subunit PurQ [Nitrospinota bacterium]|tara:strand:- start:298290 stop:298985 length:696 start_codon:yes stop_codon:yes gene_type:complete
MKIAIVQFPGSNCDHDCKHAIGQILGAKVQYVWHRSDKLTGFDAVVIPGGFSYGDYLRPGSIARFSPVMKEVARFVTKGGVVLGICNGFQILTEAGILPGALMRNKSLKFVCKDTWLKVGTTECFLTSDVEMGKVLRIPIAHMEGRYIVDDYTLEQLNNENRVIFRYCDKKGGIAEDANPNGSIENIAGIISEGRNVVGMMPHPERVCEESLGGTDGVLLLTSMLEATKIY